MEARKEMIGVDRTGDMRRRARSGEPTASIARAAGVSEPTARKCARMEDLSPEPPKRKEPESELPAPHGETTGSWPGDDCRNWRKQRHTAVRVYARLMLKLTPDLPIGTAVGILDREKVARRTTCTVQSSDNSGSWTLKATSEMSGITVGN